MVWWERNPFTIATLPGKRKAPKGSQHRYSEAQWGNGSVVRLRWQTHPRGDRRNRRRRSMDCRGVDRRLFQPLLEGAEAIIYLDYPGWLAAVGGLQRWWRHKGSTRPEMPDGCTERFDLRFLHCMFFRLDRPHIEKLLAGVPAAKIRRVRSRREPGRFCGNWQQIPLKDLEREARVTCSIRKRRRCRPPHRVAQNAESEDFR